VVPLAAPQHSSVGARHGESRVNKNAIAGIICVAAVAIYAAGWFLLPSLQGPERTVEQEASIQLERARRLLHQYDARLSYKAMLTDDLAEQGFELDPEEISEDLADEYEQAHNVMWEAYKPTDWVGDDTRVARANYSDLTRQINEGVRGQEKLVDSNDELLDEALKAAKQALAVGAGDASSRFHAEATRLKGIIYYRQGVEERLRAKLYRRRADRYRSDLVALAAAATESVAAKDLVATSNVDGEISRLEEQAAELDSLIAADESALANVEKRIAALEGDLTATEARRAEAEAARRQLQATGIDFSDPTSSEQFRERAETLDRAFRAADREAKQLLYGSYPNAQIDASHDYISGKYVEGGSTTNLTTRRGVVHERADRAVLVGRLEGLRRGVEDVRAEVGRLGTLKEAYQATQAQAIDRANEGAATATEFYAELNAIDAEAFTMEEDALELLEEAASAAKQAADFTDRWIREGSSHASASSSERNPFATRGNSRWMKGHISAQVADARLAKAWVYYDRYNAYSLNAKVLTTVAGTLELGEADNQAEREKAQAAHDAGLDEIAEAMATLKTAHQDTGKHWTLIAQAAGTTYLLALFGHEEYATDARDTYREAVKSREDDAIARVFVSRLNLLEQR